MERIIKNFDALATTGLRKDALEIAEAAYAAIDVGEAMRRRVRFSHDELSIDESMRRNLAGRRIYFVSVGKCAFAAAQAAEEIFGDRLSGGCAYDVQSADGFSLHKTVTYTGTHPEPSETNLDAAAKIVGFLSERTAEDFVLMLVSGGGSTLLCLPYSAEQGSASQGEHDIHQACLDERMLFDALTEKGASIQELNTVRKHISKARGGGLAAAAYPAEVLALIVSDVPGNDPQFISSGPTVKDVSTVEDAKAVLAKYGIAVGEHTEFLETPKDEKYFERVTNLLFLTNETALDAMRAAADARGYAARIVSDRFAGDAYALAKEFTSALHAEEAPAALLYAGESTVTLPQAHGTGGRNQALALSALQYVSDDELLLAFASDGRDAGDHAGGIADSVTRAHADERGVDVGKARDTYSSYDFFEETGDAFMTGVRESNVSDLILALKR